MKLSAIQIQKLYVFTRQHYVEYYDLQTELVDHLANAIEEQWQENPKISFEEALQKEFKKFGIFGFMDVVEKRQAAMNKKYNKIVWNHFKTFFKLPQIIGTVAAVGILFLSLKNSSQATLIVSIFAIAIMVSFWVAISFSVWKKNKIAKVEGKKWLFNEIIFGYSSIAGLSYLPLQFLVHFENHYSEIMLLTMCIVIVFMVLLEYIILILIPSKAEEYLQQTYPEYSFSR
ncbi:hypothetical protein [Flavobacterium sp.]